MNEAVKTITRTFPRKLGGQLDAIYLYGSMAQGYHQAGRSDVNLLIVVADGTNIHALRTLFLPVWEKYGRALRRAPLIAHKSAFVRHLQACPMLAHHLAREGRQLYGAPDLLDQYLPPVAPHETYAYLASTAMWASAALAPDLLDSETAAAASARLRRLLQQIHDEAAPEDETAAQLFARLQHFLEPIVAKLPIVQQWTRTKAPAATSPLLPGLQTIYKEADKMVLVFARLVPQQIVRTDWQKLSERLAGHCSGLYVTSVDQLCLILTYENPLDLLLRRYQHNWGPDFLPSLAASPRQIMRHAASLPSHILVDTLPNAYLTMPADDDESLHKLIHDFQNRMLNIQLEHELLGRLQGLERFVPPAPVPGRDTPPRQRLDAIFQHLDWWTEYYVEQMRKRES